jgi:HTH-type transcriptional regulator/antitoxin HigA
MMTERNIEYIADIAIPPGETIQDYLEEFSMTQKELALRIGMDEKTVSQIVNGKAPLTPRTALALERVFKLPTKFWLNLEADYRATLEIIEEQNSLDEDLEYLVKFPYSELAKCGLVENTRKKEEKVINLRNYLGLARLANTQDLYGGYAANFRTKNDSKVNIYALSSWLRAGELVAEHKELPKYDKRKLIRNLDKLKALSMNSSPGFQKDLENAFNRIGIALVFIPHFKETYANGATYWIGDNPVIQLSIRGKKWDIFWFSLFHEIGHLIKDGKKAKSVSPDRGHVRAGNESEAEADKFAADTLIDPADYQSLKTFYPYEYESLEQHAKRLKIHPAILIGRLQYDGLIPYQSALNNRKPSLSLKVTN